MTDIPPDEHDGTEDEPFEGELACDMTPRLTDEEWQYILDLRGGDDG